MWLQCCVPNTGWKTSVWMLIKLQGPMCIWLANQLCIGTRESAECGLINCINVAWHNTLRKSHIFGNLSKQSLIFFTVNNILYNLLLSYLLSQIDTCTIVKYVTQIILCRWNLCVEKRQQMRWVWLIILIFVAYYI